MALGCAALGLAGRGFQLASQEGGVDLVERQLALARAVSRAGKFKPADQLVEMVEISMAPGKGGWVGRSVARLVGAGRVVDKDADLALADLKERGGRLAFALRP
jgi:hypothetical protein